MILLQDLTAVQPDYSIPSIPDIDAPSVDAETGDYNGYALCEAKYPHDARPPVPYGQQSAASALATEQGYKLVRGQLTEGRYLVFEMNGYALAHSNSGYGSLIATRSSPIHDSRAQRWVLNQLQQGGNRFTVSSVLDGMCAAGLGHLASNRSDAAPIIINDLGNGKGHSLQTSSGQYLSIASQGQVTLSKTPVGFLTYSVTYST